MKYTLTIWIIILCIITGYGGCKQSGSQSDELILVDVTASYPKKELILQDFMDVEYIPLETSDTFLTQGFIQTIGKDIIIVTNYNNDGDIFIFGRDGKSVRKINRKGQGGEEYVSILGITLDEDNEEMFVNDYSGKKIVVYDLNGNFKRRFKHKENAGYSRIYNFDSQNLICYDSYFNQKGESYEQSFMIISKQDGSIHKEIQIPMEEKILTLLMLRDETNLITYSAGPSNHHPIIPYLDAWVLVEPSADTIYTYLPNHTMTPFIVRTPSIRSMDPEVFLFLSILTDRYYFMETVKKEYDFEKQDGYPSTDLMYDKQEKAILGYTVYNGDYSTKERVYMKLNSVNKEIAAMLILQAHRLVEANEKGKLKEGHLKEIAANLDEESNPVLMLLKHKK
jgi:hypothetical protein